MRFFSERRAILDAAATVVRWGLGRGSSGNLSVRVRGGFLVTATGAEWETLSELDFVFIRSDGRPMGDQPIPSSEWRIHQDLYEARPEVGAIVHTHAMYTTTVSCLRRDIPAVHYMIAVTGADVVRCAEYATFGTPELSANALTAMGSSKACLLANHGMLAVGGDFKDALKVAREVETLAEQYWRASMLGTPVVLDASEMARVRERFATYGQQPGRRRSA